MADQVELPAVVLAEVTTTFSETSTTLRQRRDQLIHEKRTLEATLKETTQALAAVEKEIDTFSAYHRLSRESQDQLFPFPPVQEVSPTTEQTSSAEASHDFELASDEPIVRPRSKRRAGKKVVSSTRQPKGKTGRGRTKKTAEASPPTTKRGKKGGPQTSPLSLNQLGFNEKRILRMIRDVPGASTPTAVLKALNKSTVGSRMDEVDFSSRVENLKNKGLVTVNGDKILRLTDMGKRLLESSK